jgi:hypothetical protein
MEVEQVEQAVETPEVPAFVPSQADQAAYEAFRRTGKPPEAESAPVEEAPAPVEGEEAAPPKKLGGFQKKLIAKDAEIAERDAKIEAERAELARVLAENQALKAKLAPPEPDGPGAEPEWDFALTDQENIKMLKDWTLKVAKHEVQVQRRQEAAQAKIQGSFAETRLIYPDFDDNIGAAAVPPEFMPILGEFLAEVSDAPGALAYRLASDPVELARIAGMSPQRAMVALAKIDATLASSASGNHTPRSTPAATPKIPAPITPIRATSAPLPDKEPSEMTQAEYEAMRNKSRRA